MDHQTRTLRSHLPLAFDGADDLAEAMLGLVALVATGIGLLHATFLGVAAIAVSSGRGRGSDHRHAPRHR